MLLENKNIKLIIFILQTLHLRWTNFKTIITIFHSKNLYEIYKIIIFVVVIQAIIYNLGGLRTLPLIPLEKPVESMKTEKLHTKREWIILQLLKCLLHSFVNFLYGQGGNLSVNL